MASVFKIGIPQNTKCDNLVGFPKSGHIYSDIYPMIYMKKTTDMSRRLRFQLLQYILFSAKTYATDKASYRIIDANFRLNGVSYVENTQRNLCEVHGMS